MPRGYGFAEWLEEKGVASTSACGPEKYFMWAVRQVAWCERGTVFFLEVVVTPTSFGDLWGRVISFENLFAAFVEARRRKRYVSDVLRYEANLEERLIELQNRLLWREWRPGAWRCFEVYEPKKRIIHAPPFCDRVVHHALVRVMEPLFERRFIADSFACRRGKGNHAAQERVVEFLRRNPRPTHVLQTDISSCFPSVNHEVLLDTIKRTIRDPDVLWLSRSIVTDGGFDGTGLPIGALTSQLFANVYLDLLDHFMKDALGVKRYVRYMDDTVSLSDDKRYLRDVYGEMDEFVRTRLLMRLNPKSGIYGVCQGVNFCGYRSWPTHVLPRKRNVRRARRALRGLSRLYRRGRVSIGKVRSVVASFLGYMQRCRGYRSAESVLAVSFGKGE